MSNQPIVKKEPQNVVEMIRVDLSRMLPQFKAILPENVTPEKFMRVLLTAVEIAPNLAACNRTSLYTAARKCAADGLLPDGKEAALIPYGDQVQYQVMVGGIYKKVRNSGEISIFCGDIVYQGDAFKFGTNSDRGRYLDHVPEMAGADRGKKENAVCVFALSKTRDGDIDFEVMTTQEVEFVRSKAKSANSPAWKDWWGEMAKKTVVKRLAKRLPLSADVQKIIDRDNEEYEVTLNAQKSRIEELQEKLHKKSNDSLGQETKDQAIEGEFKSFAGEHFVDPETIQPQVLAEDPKMVK